MPERRRFDSKQPPVNVPSKELEPFEPESKESKDSELPVGDPNLDPTETDLVPNRLKDKELRELLKHRLQGHASYHPACEQCRMSRSVKQRKRSQSYLPRPDGILNSK